MQADLDRERKAMMRLWSKREEQIRGVVESTAGLYGDLQCIAGRIPEGLFAPRTVQVPLRSAEKASPFWIILLLGSGRTNHGLAHVRQPGCRTALATVYR